MARTAVITGGGKGIGKAIAIALDREGYDLVLMGRDMDALDATATVLKSAQTRKLDVTDPESVSRAFEDLEPDVLVNNAGAVTTNPIERTTMADWQAMLAVNLTGAFLCCQQVVPIMKRPKGGGRIVNIASTASLKGYPYVTAYCAAKHGLLGLTRALAIETVRYGITVNAVCPGYTETDLLKSSIQRIQDSVGIPEEQASRLLQASNPQGRFIQPEEVAAAVVWLCSPEAASVTGQAIAIAGGEIM